MTLPKVWLSSPHMGGTEQKYIQQAFESNWVAPLGPNVTDFESDLVKYLNQDIHVTALSSGTAALHLGLILLGVSPGDEVICQSMTFSASANPIAYLGAHPIFIDSDEETWGMCPLALEEAIKNRMAAGKKPKAIIPVHLYGMPARMDEICAIAQKYEIPILEDAAEALGSTYQGQECGTFGEMAALSFNGNKIITTSGGGAFVSKDVEQNKKALFLATQARDEAPHYQHSHIGYNYRMSNIVAGIGRGQMEVLEDRVAARRAIAAKYKSYFDNIDGVAMQPELSDSKSNRWLSAIVMNPEKLGGKNREDLRHAFLLENIESRPLWKPMHLQPVFENNLYFGTRISESLFEDGLCLPSGSNLTEDEISRIFKVLDRFF
ncbi:MAG TPA: aminotransferase class I/II-fold pyridoxal phosphate-dependent enzyme [Edaphocola sp.]|nr:aminotransferase class I/II-fold pyridoxal phosphate-dependent enzyme [Edaphocola sp.]